MTRLQTPQGRRMSRKDSAAKPGRRSRTASATSCEAHAEEAPAPVLTLAMEASTAALVRPGGKLGLVADLLRRPEGARVEEMMAATGWQAHTVRGCMSGALKARLKLAVTSEATQAGRVYRLSDGQKR
jgi:hypothetical protein